MGRLERATEPLEDHAEPAQAPAQPRGALVLLLLGRRTHLGPDVAEQPVSTVRPGRRTAGGPRRAAGGTGSDRGPPGTATGSAPSARRQTDTRGASGAGRSGAGRTMNPAARPVRWRAAGPQRPDRDGVPRRRFGGDLEDRERDVEPAADVAEPLVLSRQADVAGRTMPLDQPVLEHERAELGVRALVVDHGGLDCPVGRHARGREVSPGAAPDRDRFADVQHPAGVVAEQIDAGVFGQLAEVELGRRGERRGAALAARARLRRAFRSRARPPPSAHSRTASGTSRTARARTSPRRRARGARSAPRPRAHRRARPARACSGAAAACARAPRCTGPAGSASRGRSGRTRGAARAGRTERCAPPAPGLCSSSSSGGSTASRPGASASISCVIPVKR